MQEPLAYRTFDEGDRSLKRLLLGLGIVLLVVGLFLFIGQLMHLIGGLSGKTDAFFLKARKSGSTSGLPEPALLISVSILDVIGAAILFITGFACLYRATWGGVMAMIAGIVIGLAGAIYWGAWFFPRLSSELRNESERIWNICAQMGWLGTLLFGPGLLICIGACRRLWRQDPIAPNPGGFTPL